MHADHRETLDLLDKIREEAWLNHEGNDFVRWVREKLGKSQVKAPVLKSLADFNASRGRTESTVPKKNGIACPNCGLEMVDSDPSAVLMSSPPKMRVACESCGYTGFRVA